MNKGIYLDLCLKLRNWRKRLILLWERKNLHETTRYLHAYPSHYDTWTDLIFHSISSQNEILFRFFIFGNKFLGCNGISFLLYHTPLNTKLYIFFIFFKYLTSWFHWLSNCYHLVNSQLSCWSSQNKLFFVTFKLKSFCYHNGSIKANDPNQESYDLIFYLVSPPLVGAHC